MRLGYFGGSFDPPHLGHLALARAAADAFALDCVLFVPTASQPLKPAGAVAGYSDRLAMVELLCTQQPRDLRFTASDLEAPLGPPAARYTIDTLTRLRDEEPEAELFVLVGTDAFRDLPRWRSPAELLHIAEWIVVARPSLSPPELPPLSPAERARVHLLTGFDHPGSATAIRAALARGEDCAKVLPPDILAYIRSHHLYA